MASNNNDRIDSTNRVDASVDRLDSVDRTTTNMADRNPDPITGAAGSHPVGTAIGSGSGAATGAAIGAVGGPVGALIGGVAGAVTGAVIGHKAGEANDPTESLEGRAGTKHHDPVAAATNPKPGSELNRNDRTVTPD